VKGRVFEMGLSGTMMLTQRSPDIERFYEPGKEFVAYESIEDCAEKAKFYLRNETSGSASPRRTTAGRGASTCGTPFRATVPRDRYERSGEGVVARKVA
jgi:hypothetical protein